jgi:hypothetical protein
MALVIIPDGIVAATPTWHTFDLSASDVHVTAGVTYAVALTAPAASFRWEGLPTDAYAGGSAFARDPAGGPWNPRHPVDLGFRTWVRH